MSVTVSLQHLHKAYGSRTVLDDLSLEVAAGELVVLLGASGCGKTTTLRLLAGLDAPESGAIRIDGRDVRDVPAPQRGVALVFQSLALWPHMTVEQNLRFVLRQSDGEARAREMLARFHLDDRWRAYPSDLSQGEAQRVALARALLQEPSVLLLDEPFSNLDFALRAPLLDELRRLQRARGLTTVYVTHALEEAMLLADRVAVMRAGRIEQAAPPEVVWRQPATRWVASFVGVNNLVDGRVEGGRVRCALGDAGPVDSPDGKPVALAIRPDALALDDSAATRGRVLASRFVGRHWLVTVEVGSAQVCVEHPATLDAGCEVGVALRGEPWVVPDPPPVSQ